MHFTHLRNILASDGRHFQIISQVVFLMYGILFLHWDQNYLNYVAAFSGTLATQALGIAITRGQWSGLKSAIITGLGLSLLLKANSPLIFFLAGSLAIGQKYAFRVNGKHLWNPANFGIVLSIVFSGAAWVSPGQWGTEALVILLVSTGGLAVLSKVKRLDTGIVFLIATAALEYWRTVLFLGWGHEVWLHKLSSGALWLFALFMITDPMTTPNRRSVRIGWTVFTALLSFYLTNFWFINSSVQWVLFLSTPFTPLIDKIFLSDTFQWTRPSPHQPPKNHLAMKRNILSLLLLVLAGSFLSLRASAFCGFYVAKADATLFNNKSEIILVRDGKQSVITMSNDFKGDLRDFAMVVPVPVVLKESQIKVVKRDIFDYLDAYSSPRLVEYYDHNPCQPLHMMSSVAETDRVSTLSDSFNSPKRMEKSHGVTIEARYLIGEYDILILSAKESEGLKNWLLLNGYKIPETAAEVLNPYIKSNMKFFVAKVNLKKMKNESFQFLNPIQISFESDKFMLPIRLGMANSSGSQDMIVYAFTRTGRVECTNYRTVKMATDRNIPLFVKDEFGSFYKKLFQRTWTHEGRNAVFLEYAWDVTPNWGMKCDPCVGPPPYQQEFADAGVWWANDGSRSPIFFTRMHVRYEKAKFPSDLVFQVTPNNEQYQARYVLHNPAYGELDCEEGQNYITELITRRKLEVDEYTALTGSGNPKSNAYISEFRKKLKQNEKRNEDEVWGVPGSGNNRIKILMIVSLSLIAVGGILLGKKRVQMGSTA